MYTVSVFIGEDNTSTGMLHRLCRLLQLKMLILPIKRGLMWSTKMEFKKNKGKKEK